MNDYEESVFPKQRELEYRKSEQLGQCALDLQGVKPDNIPAWRKGKIGRAHV